MIQQVIAYLQGRRTPAQMLKRSEKALTAFRKVATDLEKANSQISKEQELSDLLITRLQAQISTAKTAKAAYASVEDANKKRIQKVNDWLDDLD